MLLYCTLCTVKTWEEKGIVEQIVNSSVPECNTEELYGSFENMDSGLLFSLVMDFLALTLRELQSFKANVPTRSCVKQDLPTSLLRLVFQDRDVTEPHRWCPCNQQSLGITWIPVDHMTNMEVQAKTAQCLRGKKTLSFFSQ